VRANPHTLDVNVDWGDKVLAMRVEIDQERARTLGVTSSGVSRALAGAVSGVPIGQYRENDRLIDVMLRAPRDERDSLETWGSFRSPRAWEKACRSRKSHA
jgi:multidrug efflux pump